MSFRFYSNAVSQATRGIATGIFVVGLLLVGFGAIVGHIWELFLTAGETEML